MPGCVHTDLLAADLIDDPYLGDNELKCLWIGRCDWTCRRTFDVVADALCRDHADLAFDGLDTVAEIQVNGVVVGRSRDMHLRRRFGIKPQLRVGENELVVRFAAPLPHALAERDRLGDLPHTGEGSNPPLPHNFIRKMACNFGWDWGPVVPTCGIWRGVRLETWDVARLADVRPIVREATRDRAVLDVQLDVAGDASAAVAEVTLTSPDGREIYRGRAGEIAVDSPELWWPRSHGDQPLYMLCVVLKTTSGDELDRREHRVGLRTSRLVTEPDATPIAGLGHGESMRLEVNGEAVYCKGANWIPDDCFPSRVTRDRYRRRVEQAADANMNMLRVWGGGLYESDDFYDACDELGVMVWQDFLLACAAYSEEEPFRSLIEAEATDNVARLARHPSLVLLNGCNENLMGYDDWGYDGKTWKEHIGDRGWGLHYYLDAFPRVVSDLAPGTPYWPASPYSNDPTLGRRANLNEFGNRHIWDVWHGPGHYRNYLAHYPRFASEFGFHGPPTWATLECAVPDKSQHHWDSPTVRLHNKNGGPDGQRQTTTRMADDFDVPADFDDWLYLAQVMQARALDLGVRWFRALFPWNNGALFWQFNDCWPTFSWSSIDGAGRLKPLHHAARRFNAPRIITIAPRSPQPVDGWADAGPLSVYLHNDHAEPWSGECQLRHMTLGGDTLAATSWTIDLAPRSAAKFDVPEVMRSRPTDSFLVASLAGGERGFWWAAPDKELAYPPPRFAADVAADGSSVTLTAETLLRDVCLFADRLDPSAEAGDACVTLLPGEQFTFAIRRGTTSLDRDALVRPPVLQCVNRFGRRGDLA